MDGFLPTHVPKRTSHMLFKMPESVVCSLFVCLTKILNFVEGCLQIIQHKNGHFKFDVDQHFEHGGTIFSFGSYGQTSEDLLSDFPSKPFVRMRRPKSEQFSQSKYKFGENNCRAFMVGFINAIKN